MIVLPFPPSVNGLYGGGSAQKRFPSKKYKAWLAACPKITTPKIKKGIPVKLLYTFAWPDNRIRDGQNYMKAVLDYIVKQGILVDDNWKIVIGESWDHVGVDKINPRVEVEIILQ